MGGEPGTKRTASPLTPALSPLRGEGVARLILRGSDTTQRGYIASKFDRASNCIL
jgi:hypothetical protein